MEPGAHYFVLCSEPNVCTGVERIPAGRTDVTDLPIVFS